MFSQHEFKRLSKQQPAACLLATACDVLFRVYGTEYLLSYSSETPAPPTRMGNDFWVMNNATMLLLGAGGTSIDDGLRDKNIAIAVQMLSTLIKDDAELLDIPNSDRRINKRVAANIAADLIQLEIVKRKVRGS